MNLYKILDAAAEIFGEPATLKKRNGLEILLNVTPHEASTQQVNGRYPEAFGTVVYSVSADALTLDDGTKARPEPGDVLEMFFGGGSRRYKIVKSATTARAWDWLWDRAGDRIKFYCMRTDEQ